MEEKKVPKRRNFFNLIIGLAFFGYGLYRIYTFFTGTEYSTFRVIVAVGFIVLGIADLYRFYKPKNRNKKKMPD